MQEVAAAEELEPTKPCGSSMIPLPAEQQLMKQEGSSSAAAAFTPRFLHKHSCLQKASETSKQKRQLLQAESTLVKQGSIMEHQHQHQQKQLALLRHASSQCSDALERMDTPSPATMKRTLSILVGGLGPQLQQSFIKNIAPPSSQHQQPQPQQIDFTSFINGVAQTPTQPHQPKSPNMLFQQPSFVHA